MTRSISSAANASGALVSTSVTHTTSPMGGGPATYSAFAARTRFAPSIRATVYGPDPTNWFTVCQSGEASAWGGTTAAVGVAARARKWLAGCSRWTTSVRSSGVLIPTSSIEPVPARQAAAPSITFRTSGANAPVAGSRMRSHERRMSAETSGVPSLKWRSSRSWKVYVRPSSLTSQLSAREA